MKAKNAGFRWSRAMLFCSTAVLAATGGCAGGGVDDADLAPGVEEIGSESEALDAKELVLKVAADSHVRTDLDIRRNDNHGCQEAMVIGTNRGGGDLPWGAPDAMRGLVRFDLSTLPAGAIIQNAVLDLTVYGFDSGLPTSVFNLDAHRLLGPWDEGNGLEVGALLPPGCANVDEASGVAWEGMIFPDGLNNQTQPAFDPMVIASAQIARATTAPGTHVQMDVTALVKGWSSGKLPNHGILLRDVSTDDSFRGVQIGARDGFLRNFPFAVDGPKLIVKLTVNPCAIHVTFQALHQPGVCPQPGAPFCPDKCAQAGCKVKYDIQVCDNLPAWPGGAVDYSFTEYCGCK